MSDSGSSTSAFSKTNCCNHLATFIIIALWMIFAAFEFSVPFFMFQDDAQNRQLTNDNPRMLYLYMSPMFVIPVIGVLSIFVGLCTYIGGAILHFLTFGLNVGCMAYYIVYFKSLPGIDLTDKAYQIVVPPISMGLVAVFSAILMIDQVRKLIVYLRKRSKQQPYQQVPNDDPDA